MSLLSRVNTYAFRLCKESFEKNPVLAEKIISLFNEVPIDLDEDTYDDLAEFMYNQYFSILELITPYLLACDNKLDNWCTGDEGVMLLIITHPYIYDSEKINTDIQKMPSKYAKSFVNQFKHYYKLAYNYMESKIWYCNEYLDAEYKAARDGIDNRILLYMHQDCFDIDKSIESLYCFYKFAECLERAIKIAEREIGYVVTFKSKKYRKQS
ncbi:MAG: hypothetical protein AB7G87_03795 [Clostridia bacterium]